MDTSKIFDGYAKDYTAGRPDYAMELIEYMSEIKGVFEKNCVNGMALIANQSVAYFGAP